MLNPLVLLENRDFREFVELLNSNGVRFLVVGGHAVAVPGCPRFTGDLDIWIATDAENAVRMEQVLEQFGFGSLHFKAKDFTRPGYAIQLGRPPCRIDILTFRNKRAVGRDQDLSDVARLEAQSARAPRPRARPKRLRRRLG